MTAVLAVAGPRSRDVLGKVCVGGGGVLSNDAFPFGTAQQLKLAVDSNDGGNGEVVTVLALRVRDPPPHTTTAHRAHPLRENRRRGTLPSSVHDGRSTPNQSPLELEDRQSLQIYADVRYISDVIVFP